MIKKRLANFVGLDYHNVAIQVCVLDGEGRVLCNRRVANDWQSIRDAVEAHGPVKAVAIEACVGAAHLAEELHRQCGWKVHLCHPGYVRRMKQNPDKSDFSDARLLADLIRVGYLPRVWLAPEAIQELRRLVRYRQQLAERRRNTKLRIGALLREHRTPGRRSERAWTRPWMAWLKQVPLSEQTRWILDRHLANLNDLNQAVREVEDRLETVTQDDPVVQKLLTFCGVGLVTACALRAEIGCFERFRSGKQLARFCGLSPRNASSGERQADAGLIPAGQAYLRTILMETSHRLIRLDPRWKEFGKRLRQAGKPGSVVAAAVANRWMRRLYHDMQSAA